MIPPPHSHTKHDTGYLFHHQYNSLLILDILTHTNYRNEVNDKTFTRLGNDQCLISLYLSIIIKVACSVLTNIFGNMLRVFLSKCQNEVEIASYGK